MADPLEIIEGYLNQTDMKFSQVGDHAFVLPFISQEVARILVTVSAPQKFAFLDTQIHVDECGPGEGSYQLLRATFRMSMIKHTCDEEGDLFLAAQVPIDLLDRFTLEGLIRALAVLADINPHRVVDALAVGRASAILRTYRRMSSESRNEPPAAERMEDTVKAIGATASRVGDAVFSIEGGPLQAKVMAECHDHQVSLRVLFKSLTPAPGDRAFSHELAVANHRLGVAKFSLDEDDHLAISYEVPCLSPQALVYGIDSINTSVGALGPLTALLRE